MRAELAALELRRLSWKRLWRGIEAVGDEFLEYDLLSYAGAIAFQVLYAVVPLLLLALGLLGLLGFDSVYTKHVAPVLRREMSHDAYLVVNQTARKVLTKGQVYWTTAGLAVTVWGVSGSIRAMTRALNMVYGTKETRTFWNRLATSFGVAVFVIVCVYAAIIVVLGGRLVHPHPWPLAVLLFLARWLAALALLLAAIAALIRFVPAKKRPPGWVSLGSLLSAFAWIGATLLFATYVRVVSYTSVYGVFAVLVVLLAYLYYSAAAFLFGVVVDSLLREQVSRRGRR